MNKSLSLFFCLSLVLPLHAMEVTMQVDNSLDRDPQSHMSTPRRLAHKAWEAITCKKIFIAVVSLAAVSLISVGGYFMTSTCLRMENSCNNCTSDFTHANCALGLLGTSSSLLKKLLTDNPTLALKYASELSKLNVTC